MPNKGPARLPRVQASKRVTSLPSRYYSPRTPVPVLYSASHVIVVACDKYLDRRFPALEQAVSDARRVTEALMRHGFELYASLLGSDATAANFRRALDDYSRFIGSSSPVGPKRLVCYVGCHGYVHESVTPDSRILPVPYFAFYDTKWCSPRSTALRMSELGVLASTLGVVHQCYIVDSCHAGQVLSRARRPSLSSALLERPSCVALCSSACDGNAGEDVGGSFLVQTLTELLDDASIFDRFPSLGRRYVTLDSLVDEIRDQTSSRAAAHGRGQLVVYGSLLPRNEGSLIFFEEDTEESCRSRSFAGGQNTRVRCDALVNVAVAPHVADEPFWPDRTGASNEATIVVKSPTKIGRRSIAPQEGCV